jgi:hypothetical protein
MMQAALGRWQVAGTHAHQVMVRWWLNRRLDLITWRRRLNALWWVCWQRQVQSQEEVRMTCHRCRGLLVKDQSVVESLHGLSEVPGCRGPTMRCINCGYLEDPVVRANRLRPLVARQPAPALLDARESSRRKSLMFGVRVSQPIQTIQRRCSP